MVRYDINQPLTIEKFPVYSETTDYKKLVQDFTLACQKYSGLVWTDYNYHDPGVTIYELLSLCITELGLKTEQDIFRIIFHENRQTFNPVEYALYSPLEVFPTEPVTIDDYRKLFIDTFHNSVENIWIEPVMFTASGIHYKGLINILVKPKPDIDKKILEQDIYTLFNKIKNIGEDLQEIIFLEESVVTIKMNATIKGDYLPEEVLAEIRQIIYWSIEKPVKFENYFDLVQNNIPIEDILTGPLLNNGYIDDATLDISSLEKTRVFYKSHLLHAISKSSKIERIDHLSLYVNGDEIRDDNIEFQNYIFPHFDFNNSTFNLYKNDILLSVNKETQEFIFKSSYGNKKVFSKKSLEEYLKPNLESPIQLKEISYFFSMQNQFPRIYGVSYFGPMVNHPKYKASALQLKVYLTFFEQIMKNYLTQLANVDKLFSIERTEEQTYYTEYPTEVPDLDQLITVPIETYKANVDSVSQLFDNKYYRRDMFINHLLARFGESIELNNNYLASNYYQDEYSKYTKDTKLKCNFLRNYISLSKNRTKSYLDLNDETTGISSFQLKLLILLGIENMSFRKTTDFSAVLSKYKDPKIKFQIKSNEELRQLFESVINENNLQLEEGKSGYEVIYYTPNGQRQSIYKNASYASCEVEIDNFLQKGQELNQYCEYFHIIENILIRPENDDLAASDPYSNICNIFLPDWPARFQQKTFKTNFENLVKTNAPIHIHYNIFWLEYGQMAEFEGLMEEWKKNKKASKTKKEQAKKDLRDFIFNL